MIRCEVSIPLADGGIWMNYLCRNTKAEARKAVDNALYAWRKANPGHGRARLEFFIEETMEHIPHQRRGRKPRGA